MFKRVSPYIGEYKKYTVCATIMMCIGIIASIVPYFFLYQIISPLTRGEHIDTAFILFRVIAVAVCEIIFSVSYVQGLTFSHISAYNTLKNLRVSLNIGNRENDLTNSYRYNPNKNKSSIDMPSAGERGDYLI